MSLMRRRSFCLRNPPPGDSGLGGSRGRTGFSPGSTIGPKLGTFQGMIAGLHTEHSLPLRWGWCTGRRGSGHISSLACPRR